jgi:hypothetical protein
MRLLSRAINERLLHNVRSLSITKAEVFLLSILVCLVSFVIVDWVATSQSFRLDLLSLLTRELRAEEFEIIENRVGADESMAVVVRDPSFGEDEIRAWLKANNWEIIAGSAKEILPEDELSGFGIVSCRKWLVSKGSRKGIIQIVVSNVKREHYSKIEVVAGLRLNSIIFVSIQDSRK